MASTQERELQLVGNVELRIASAKTDDDLKSRLNRYLVPLLLKLASPHLAVRNEVIKVCRFVDTCLGPTNFELPLRDLLTQFKDVPKELVRLFDLRYIKVGLERINAARRRDYFPQVIRGLHLVYEASPKQASGLFSLFVRLLLDVPLPPRASQEDLKLRDKFELASEDTKFLSKWLGSLLLYQGPSVQSHPGLDRSASDFLGFGDDKFWKAPGRPEGQVNLTEVKIAVAKFLASGVFDDSERLIPAIIAASDINSRISDTGNDMLKRCLAVSDVEEVHFVDSLLNLYSGATPIIPPARPPLKIRILNVLSKSAQAAKHPGVEKIVRDALDPEIEGLEGSKLRTAAFIFVNWLTRMSEGAIDPAPLIEETKILIEGQGWPEVAKTGSTQGDAAALEARGKAYETLGLLIRTKPQTSVSRNALSKTVKLIGWLFRSLQEDTSSSEVALSIESAISNTLVSIISESLSIYEEEELLNILEKFIHSDLKADITSRTAYPALRFVNQCFPFNNSRARYLNVLALASNGGRRELQEESAGGLDPFIHSKVYRRDSQMLKLPTFSDMSTAFFARNRDLLSPSGEAMTRAIIFCKAVLLHEALASGGRDPILDGKWLMNIESALANDEEAIGAVNNHLSHLATSTPKDLSSLEMLLKEAFDFTVGRKASSTVAEALLDLVRFSPDKTLGSIQKRASELKIILVSSEPILRRTAARCFGIIASAESISSGNIAETGRDLWATVDKKTSSVGADVWNVQGALFALGMWLSRLSYRARSVDDDRLIYVDSVISGDETVSDSATSFDFEELSTQMSRLSQVCLKILRDMDNKDLWQAAVCAMVEMLRFNASPSLTDFALEDENSDVMDKITLMAKQGHSNAVTLLGLFTFTCATDAIGDSPIIKLVDKLYSLHEEKKAELQFEVGAAFSLVAFAQESKALIGWIDVAGTAPGLPLRDVAAQVVFGKAVEACKHTKPSLRQSGAIWLLCLLQYGGHTKFMQQNLPTCQLAFKALLGDKDTLNQESAASGLTLVYERGDREVKDQLVKDLVGSFISAEPTNLSGQVSQDTQLFDEGALPTESGRSVTTYGDIVKLAREVGDDGLVYRFMNLAKNSSVWTSRAAFGRFGLSKVLSDASDGGYLAQNPKLYRALYRYRFDPNPNVRSAMSDIWSALVKDPTAIVNEHFDDILEDLLKHMVNGKEWRSRQASCTALGDLIQGRPLEKYEKRLNDIWSQAFKLTDDRKQSVQAEAAKLVRVLTAIVKRTLEAGEGSVKNATAMLKQVLPFLLGDRGVNSSVKEAQLYALKTITDLVKAGTAVALRPFLPDMICGLLEQLSAMEPEMANYVHLNADKYGITTQQLDDARMSSVGRSPVMDAVERCIDHLDDASMKELHPRLLETVKGRAIGLPSRVGVSRALISLATRRNFLFRQYAGEFLTQLRNKFVVDRNDTVSTSAATACGYLARIAPNKTILKAVEWSQKQFFESEDERRRVIAGEIMLSFGKYATDRFNDLSSSILPFIFLAKHDTFETSRELFRSAWEDNVSGSRIVLLHLQEILALCDEYLGSPRWPIKHASAFAIAEAVNVAGKDLDEVTARLLWPSVDKAIGGKTWDGKEKVLHALVQLAKHSTLLKNDKDVSTQMQKIIIREAKRQNSTYQQHGIEALGDFILICPEKDWFEQVHGIVEPMIDQLTETLNERMDVDAKQSDVASSRVVALRTLANAVKTLFAAVSPDHHQGGELKKDLESVLVPVKKAMTENDRSINEAIFECVKDLFSRLQQADAALHDAILSQYSEVLFGQDDYPEQTRLKAAGAVLPLATLAKSRPAFRTELESKIAVAMSQERSKTIENAWANVTAELQEGR